MDIPNFIGLYPNMATDDYCERMINRHRQLEKNTSAWRGEDSNLGLSNRKDFSFMFNLDAEDLAQETNSILNDAIRLYAEEFPSFGMQPCYSNYVKVQKTPPKGGFHVWHCEHAPGRSSEMRNLTWTIYLNDIPEGEGETEFLEYGIKIVPKRGLVSFFPASFTHTHRGNPVYSCDKYIATGWYYLNA